MRVVTIVTSLGVAVVDSSTPHLRGAVTARGVRAGRSLSLPLPS